MQVSIDDARRFATDVLTRLSIPADIAADVADHLIESDRVGYSSHGLSILPNYRRVLAAGFVTPNGRPERVVDRGALLAYDGHSGFGQHVGKIVMEDAIARVREHGQCVVTLRHSHHLGRMGHYGEMVAEQGFVLLAFTNVVNRPPIVAPFGGREARLTTNPLCFAGPLPGGRPPFVVDIATSAIAVNKARVLAENGREAPTGSVIDADGQPTTDPNVLFTEPPGALLPFGAHKGYALGLVAELLAGVLSGGGTIHPDNPRNGVAHNNMFALVLDPQVDFNATLAGSGQLSRLFAELPAAGSFTARAISRRIRGEQSRTPSDHDRAARFGAQAICGSRGGVRRGVGDGALDPLFSAAWR